MIRRATKIIAVLGVLLGFFSTQSQAQSVGAQARAKNAIQTLQNGFLLIRLTSNHKKMEAMKTAIANQENPTVKNRLQKQLLKVKTETGVKNYTIMQAFRENFTFAPVYFTYDTTIQSIKLSEKSGFLLDEKMEVDPGLQLPSTDFLTLRFGYTDPANTFRVYAMIFTDRNLDDLPDSFPNVFKMNTFAFVTNKILAPKDAFLRNIRKRVGRMDLRLAKFAGKVK